MTDKTRRWSGTVSMVLRVLAENPEGLTLRQLGRMSGVPVSTLRYHLVRDLAGFVDDLVVGPETKPFARLLRLKPGARSRGSVLLQRVLGDIR